MKSLLVGATSAALGITGTNVFVPFVTNGSGSAWTAVASPGFEQPLPHAITLDRLIVNVATAPGVGNNIVFTVLKNGSATALTVTISGTNTSASDLSDTVSFNAGDYIQMQANQSASATNPGQIWWSARQDASGLTAILGSTKNTGTGFYSVMGYNSGSVPVGDAGIIVPCAGTIKNLYIISTGSGPVLTVYKNGSAQTLTVTLAAATGHDTTHSFSVAAGDRIALDASTSGKVLGWGMSFAPTTDGQSFIGHIDNGHNTPTSGNSYYQPLADGDATWDTTESNTYLRLQSCTILGLYSETSVSPGVAPLAYTFTVRQNAGSTSAAVTINDASNIPADNGSGRAGNITGLSITVADGDTVDIQNTPANTPTGLHAFNSILINANPAVPVVGALIVAQAVKRAGYY